MRTQTSIALLLLLAGCSLPGGTPPPPAITPGPPPNDCVPIARAILGTWQNDEAAEEYRADGAYLLNAQEGAYRFEAPGVVVLDVIGRHEERLVGLTDVNELIAADEHMVGHVSSRISPPPSIPQRCYDLSTSIVGTWLGGEAPETFGADGTYRAGEEEGTWTMPSNGHVTLRTQDGTHELMFAQLSDTTAMSFDRAAGARASLLTRAR